MVKTLLDELIRLRKLVAEPALDAILDEVEILLDREREIEAEALLQNVAARLETYSVPGTHAAA